MEWITIILVAIGLCFDSFAVSVSVGICRNNISFKEAFRVAFWLALFQGVMPLIGWLAGVPLRDLLSDYDHWIAFALLAFIGGKMVIESLGHNERRGVSDLGIWVVWGMALATSLDALAVGFSFALTNLPVLMASLIIAIITGIASMLGMFFGKKVGGRNLKWIEALGGFILIAIGVKIIVTHMNWL